MGLLEVLSAKVTGQTRDARIRSRNRATGTIDICGNEFSVGSLRRQVRGMTKGILA